MTRRRIIIILLLLAASLMCWLASKWWLLTRQGPADPSRLQQSGNAIAALAEAILPRTDTPGAKDVQVEKFIIDMVIHCMSDTEQYTFIKGLERVQQRSLNWFSRPIPACSDAECVKLMRWLEQQDGTLIDIPLLNKVRRKLFGRTFFQLLKSLTVEGYCTSEIGATQGLAFDAIPGNYTPCLTINKGQKAWATT